MAHIPEEALRDMLESAGTKVEIGSSYAHYKHPDLTYTVKELLIWEATGEIAVVYQAEYGERITYACPLNVWLETVEWAGKRVPRFTKVASS